MFFFFENRLITKIFNLLVYFYKYLSSNFLQLFSKLTDSKLIRKVFFFLTNISLFFSEIISNKT